VGEAVQVRNHVRRLRFCVSNEFGQPEQGYFADGIVYDIIRGLAALKELFVVSRGSALGYGGRNIDVRKIGRQLGVRYVL